MKLSLSQFEEKLKDGDLVLSLIGMSDVGKTYWSKKFADLNFQHISCDDMIEFRLASHLREIGYKGIEDVARWMGKPNEEESLLNQTIYLDFEREVMHEVLKLLRDKENMNLVIDTTGSLVHTGEDICTKLKSNSFVVYIEASADAIGEMFIKFLKEPKPVVWGNLYKSEVGESINETLRRCYKDLLTWRGELYKNYADITMPYQSVLECVDATDFLSLVKNFL